MFKPTTVAHDCDREITEQPAFALIIYTMKLYLKFREIHNSTDSDDYHRQKNSVHDCVLFLRLRSPAGG